MGARDNGTDVCKGDALPPGTPQWITPELVRYTLEVWQPHYQQKLTVDDAIEMIVNAYNLYAAVK